MILLSVSLTVPNLDLAGFVIDLITAAVLFVMFSIMKREKENV